MATENTKFDTEAIRLYNLNREGQNGWDKNFEQIKRTERDYWRGLAQVALEEKGI